MARDLQGVLDAVLAGMVVLDAEGRVELLNAAACRMLETSAQAAAGQAAERLFGPGHPIALLARGVLGSGRAFTAGELEIERRGEPALEVDVSAAPLFDPRGARDGVVLVLRDRTLQRRLEELASQRERLAAFGRIAAGIAHEVRNPLNAIGLAAQRVERAEAAEAESRRLAGVISEEVERLNRLVEEVLRYARPQEARRIRFDGKDLLQAVEYLARPEAEKMGVRLEVHAEPGLEVDGDPDLLRGAAWNLVRNALQASPQGGKVSVSLSRSGAGAQLEVKDQGPGVPAERRGEIFTPFVSGRADGFGLGLPLALSAAQAHGGTVDVRDAPGGGAMFVMTIPEGA